MTEVENIFTKTNFADMSTEFTACRMCSEGQAVQVLPGSVETLSVSNGKSVDAFG